jgi:hypothetical protein
VVVRDRGGGIDGFEPGKEIGHALM